MRGACVRICEKEKAAGIAGLESTLFAAPHKRNDGDGILLDFGFWISFILKFGI